MKRELMTRRMFLETLEIDVLVAYLCGGSITPVHLYVPERMKERLDAIVDEDGEEVGDRR